MSIEGYVECDRYGRLSATLLELHRCDDPLQVTGWIRAPFMSSVDFARMIAESMERGFKFRQTGVGIVQPFWGIAGRVTSWRTIKEPLNGFFFSVEAKFDGTVIERAPRAEVPANVRDGRVVMVEPHRRAPVLLLELFGVCSVYRGRRAMNDPGADETYAVWLDELQAESPKLVQAVHARIERPHETRPVRLMRLRGDEQSAAFGYSGALVRCSDAELAAFRKELGASHRMGVKFRERARRGLKRRRRSSGERQREAELQAFAESMLLRLPALKTR